MGELTLAVAVAVPLVSALLYAAFHYPEFYDRHLRSATLTAPVLVLILYAFYSLGFSNGASAQLDHMATTGTLAPNMPGLVPTLVMFAVSEALFLALAFISSVSPKRAKS